ncbi:MAG: TIGR03960 family B12-binding radical SAM protein [Oscillospiraceae bacterium]|nr:TIGR03960 family B12-binding radical SAM protein [Oscillospiraceae bacterium]
MDKNLLEEILPLVQKPARYSGGEVGQVVKDKNTVDVRMAFCFPDKYEVGMSHLGIKILYGVLNSMDGVWCERVFAPDVDMEKMMREKGLHLYALESKDELSEFDFIGFTLQYELCYTNLLNMLDLAGLEVRADKRGDELKNIIIAGGPCACNPEPLADFVDIFSIGEGEEALPELMELYREAKKEGIGKREFLKRAVKLEGFYVPSFYDVDYNEDGTIKSISPKAGTSAPQTIRKRVIKDLDKVYYPDKFIVPFVETVHDRVALEVMRGCIRGCRFCQAGFIYRPLRQKSSATLNKNAKDLCSSTGYDEISLLSLSTSDYSDLNDLMGRLLNWSESKKIGLSLPSLRIDNFSEELLQKIARVRKSGLTFAPEAGTQRMRDVINKNITEEEIMSTCAIAFAGGYSSVKLYFMLGLPYETDEDIEGIAVLAQKIVDLYYSMPDKPKGRGVSVTISLASFVPKPFTPFEFEPQDTIEQIREKQALLRSKIKSKKITVNWHESKTSVLEGIFARADRRVGKLIETAWRKGCKFDSWDENFRYDLWEEAISETGIDKAFYANRKRDYGEIMPWEHIDHGASKEFFIRENVKASRGETTKNCREGCSGCGADKFVDGKCKMGGIVCAPEETFPDSTEEREEEKSDCRAVFRKEGDAKYISHLDLNRCFQRAIKRSGIPVWYTEGFNPHIYLMFSLPLSLGYESEYETVDFRITEKMDYEELKERLNGSLPEGIRIVSVARPVKKASEIASALYSVSIYCDDTEKVKAQLYQFIESPEIPVVKKGKGGEKTVDIKKYMEMKTVNCDSETVNFEIVLSAGTEQNINVGLFTDAFLKTCGVTAKSVSVKRKKIYDSEGNLFC